MKTPTKKFAAAIVALLAAAILALGLGATAASACTQNGHFMYYGACH